MMNKNDNPRPLSVMEIERFAIHDGPGIRTLVFLQGCPLHCSWCSNPESQQIRTHLLHLQNKCTRCGACFKACPNGAISFLENRPVFHREKCVACESCGRACLQNAIRFVGRPMLVEEVMDVIRRDEPYYRDSGGGVTFSGGEAFVQFGGLIDLLTACKAEGIHTAVETCGQVPPEKIKKAFELIDLFLFDVKHTNSALLKQETGACLDTVLENLTYIAALDPSKVIIRTPVIPGFNFGEEHIEPIFRLALNNNISSVHLLPYHTLGENKYEQLGLTYSYPCDRMLSKEALLPLKQLGTQMGLNVQIGG